MVSLERKLFHYRRDCEKEQEEHLDGFSRVRTGIRRVKVSCTQDMPSQVKDDVVSTLGEDVVLHIVVTMLGGQNI